MIFKYVVHDLVQVYEALGWARQEALDGTHHGVYSALMCWEGSGEPKYP